MNIKNFRFMKDKNGLTLVETVIAMVIAAVILLGFLQICSSYILALRIVKYRARAIAIAQAEIEDIKALGHEGIDVADFPTQVNVIIDEGLTTSFADDVLGVMTTDVNNVTSAPLNGRKIVIQVAWSIYGQDKQEVLEGLIYSNR